MERREAGVREHPGELIEDVGVPGERCGDAADNGALLDDLPGLACGSKCARVGVVEASFTEGDPGGGVHPDVGVARGTGLALGLTGASAIDACAPSMSPRAAWTHERTTMSRLPRTTSLAPLRPPRGRPGAVPFAEPERSEGIDEVNAATQPRSPRRRARSRPIRSISAASRGSFTARKPARLFRARRSIRPKPLRSARSIAPRSSATASITRPKPAKAVAFEIRVSAIISGSCARPAWARPRSAATRAAAGSSWRDWARASWP